ncbi:MAG: ATP-dependent DNA helicase RecQ [Bdellovibrio sp.]|nr:ATP-dependent DNA helicase RecQ [Bdellovibrio sp.]
MISLEKHLLEKFKYDSFRFPQKEIIEKTLAHQSFLALMPTGAGKSLTYQFAATLCEGKELVLVVSPLIALMQDQTKKAIDYGIDATFINSSLSAEQKENRMKQIGEGKYKLIFVAPERFRKPAFWQCLEKRTVKLFVVDEAHCISLWGHDFRPDYSKLEEYRQKLGKPTLLALTATATGEVQQDIAKQFNLDLTKDLILGGLERPNLSLNILETYAAEDKNEKLLELISKHADQSGVIYFSLIQTLENAARFLYQNKIYFQKYHGDLPPDQRRRNQNDFITGKVPWILATPAFGLGIDKSNIRAVIHYEIPSSIEAYFQEVGRAGRDGAPAFGYFLYSEDDLTIQMQFLNWAYPEKEFIEKVYDLIESRPDVVSQNGFEFLREQMVFKNKKDYRVNAAVSILTRWGCLEETDTPFGFKALQAPTEENFALEDQNVLKKEHQKKLLSLLRFIQDTEICRLQQVYTYFGYDKKEHCGICDVCLAQ